MEQESARQEIADSACSLIGDPAFADLFGEDSLAEAPIAATLPDGRVVAGTVDRLCVGPDLVRVIDFKTGRTVPADVAGVTRRTPGANAGLCRGAGGDFPGPEDRSLAPLHVGAAAHHASRLSSAGSAPI